MCNSNTYQASGEHQDLFADIILPIAIPKLLTYRIPGELSELIARGSRVIVPLGPKKILTGLVEKIHTVPPSYVTKDIMDVLDEAPVVNPIQLKFFHWLADYYLCTVGEVMQLALPTGFKLSSQSKIQLHPELALSNECFSDKEQALIQELKRRPDLTYTEAAAVVGQKSVHQLVKALLQKKAILLFEEVREKYIPKKVKRVRLNEVHSQSPLALQELFKQLEGNSKQLDVLLKYMAQVPVHQPEQLEGYYMDKKELLQVGSSSSSLQTLIKKQIFIEEEIIVSRFGYAKATASLPSALSQAQSAALDAIHHQFQKKKVVLLHGATGSGKTEIYTHLIQEALQSGGQVLYLLPEIALTTQMVKRLKKTFGEQMGVYHSKYSNNERVEVWNNVLSGAFSFVLGVRSATFLPFNNLSLIIVDEEHEISYKQFDAMPRYHARDTALVLANYHYAKVLLGSATPAMETYYNAQSGKYGFVTLQERFGAVALPEVVFANVHIERKRKTIREDFTKVLLKALEQTLDRKEQAILFQNRRGYASYITCESCTWVPMCIQCAVSLTYHQFNDRLTCHYCGYYTKVPLACETCGSHQLKNVGFGTEKLEETLQLFFPKKSIQRMDSDTTRGKYNYDKIIEALEQGNTDILVGTQMIAKGLDFDQVSLVGVMDIDRLIYFPDFRAGERCFQLLTQVGGRAGRRATQGRVIIQTAHPDHPVLKAIAQHDYEQMYRRELAERKEFLYPPFVRLVKVSLKHKDKILVTSAAQAFAQKLQEKLGNWVIGPQAPLVAKLKNQYLMDIWVKIKKGTGQHTAIKSLIRETSRQFLLDRAFKQVQVVFDVDPT